METILVLPVLLLLFGGLFVVGDIAHGRLHSLTADRMAAWSAGSRFENGRTNLVSRSFRHLGPHTALTLEKAYADWYPDADGVRPHGTEWLDFTGGRTDARVEVPMWAAVANVHNVVNQRDQGEYLSSVWKLNVKGGTDHASDYQEFDRQYVVRRAADSSIDREFRRTRPAAKLGWFTIPLDDWPDGDKGVFSASSVPKLPSRHPFVRHPAALAVGE